MNNFAVALNFIGSKKWEKVVSRELSFIELYCAAVAYTRFPFENSMDSLVVVKNGMATRYCIPEQLKQLEVDIKTTSLAEVMQGCIATDAKFNSFLDKQPLDDIEEFIREYTDSWLGELLGYYIGNYSADNAAIELSNQLRGIHNAQHRAADHFLPLFLKLLSEKFSLPSGLVKFISPQDIIDRNVSETELKQRSDFYALVTVGKEIIALSGSEAEAVINKVISEEKVDVSDVIKGQISFTGKATGTVKIVNTVEDMQKVNDGDILVSIMTRTNFISAMQKAAAFVTDEGGITCHAAIVARELRKPCLVGTKIASKVLHDGDLVEVDAVTGVVNRIK
jgi:phosphohistidine swiveling domain-containing protein